MKQVNGSSKHTWRHGVWLLPVLLVMTAAGCRSTIAAREFPQIPSHAIGQDVKTSLGDALAADVAAHRGRSGFRVLKTGSSSYAARLGLIEAAEKTLDLQYYSIHDDLTANLLLEAVIRAARRGVRIRLLIDGINVGEVQDVFSVLDEFKNLEIRVFNPFATRDDGLTGRLMKALTDIDSINYRMHNKALVADNQMAIIGGRNLGDEYFEENTDVTFKDIDILTAGPITADISASFDDYWNNEKAVPIGQLQRPRRDPALRQRLQQALAAEWDRVATTQKGARLLNGRIADRLKDVDDLRLTWARAEVVADKPEKVTRDAGNNTSPPMRRLGRVLAGAKKEFVAVSPYFVPRDEGVAYLQSLRDRGLAVRVLTNSLASTDVVAVHTGYRRYRPAVAKMGVELYEMKPIDGQRPRQRLLGSSAPAAASLHAKVYVADRRDVMIASFNLDPRSIELNTEIAVLIHSPAIAAEMIDMFDEVASPDTSYRILATDRGIVWRTREKGRMVDLTSEPQAGFWRGLQTNLMSVLPIEGSL